MANSSIVLAAICSSSGVGNKLAFSSSRCLWLSAMTFIIRCIAHHPRSCLMSISLCSSQSTPLRFGNTEVLGVILTPHRHWRRTRPAISPFSENQIQFAFNGHILTWIHLNLKTKNSIEQQFRSGGPFETGRLYIGSIAGRKHTPGRPESLQSQRWSKSPFVRWSVPALRKNESQPSTLSSKQLILFKCRLSGNRQCQNNRKRFQNTTAVRRTAKLYHKGYNRITTSLLFPSLWCAGALISPLFFLAPPLSGRCTCALFSNVSCPYALVVNSTQFLLVGIGLALKTSRP